MPISDRSRKILWARSGNLCALCKRRLVADSTALDAASVIGSECHIISKATGGPRYDPAAQGDLDGEDNLLLLCQSDHKVVDDQVGAYSVEKLKQLKGFHEAFVRGACKEASPLKRHRRE